MRLAMLLIGLLGCAVLPVRAAEKPPLPPGSVVVDRILERAAKVAQDRETYVYSKLVKTDIMDSQGHVEKTSEKTYEVTQVGGVTYARLLKFVENGKLKSARTQDRKEQDEKTRLSQSSSKGRRGKYDSVITRELMDRYVWIVEEREVKSGRATLRLRFSPKSSGLKEDSLADRILNRLGGLLWVDEQDWEVVKLDARLQERVTVWGGVLGAMDAFQIVMERARSAGGTWYVALSTADISGRKFLSTMRARSREESSDFHVLKAGAK